MNLTVPDRDGTPLAVGDCFLDDGDGYFESPTLHQVLHIDPTSAGGFLVRTTSIVGYTGEITRRVARYLKYRKITCKQCFNFWNCVLEGRAH